MVQTKTGRRRQGPSSADRFVGARRRDMVPRGRVALGEERGYGGTRARPWRFRPDGRTVR